MKYKSLVLSLFRWVLSILGLASFTSCGDVRVEVMYGQPSMDFSVSGKVKDVKGCPIKGIEVTPASEYYVYIPSKITTDENGAFLVAGSAWPEETIDLVFTDVDGEENGGEFKTKEQQVKLTQTEKSDNAWYRGVFEATDVNVTMER